MIVDDRRWKVDVEYPNHPWNETLENLHLASADLNQLSEVFDGNESFLDVAAWLGEGEVLELTNPQGKRHYRVERLP